MPPQQTPNSQPVESHHRIRTAMLAAGGAVALSLAPGLTGDHGSTPTTNETATEHTYQHPGGLPPIEDTSHVDPRHPPKIVLQTVPTTTIPNVTTTTEPKPEPEPVQVDRSWVLPATDEQPVEKPETTENPADEPVVDEGDTGSTGPEANIGDPATTYNEDITRVPKIPDVPVITGFPEKPLNQLPLHEVTPEAAAIMKNDTVLLPQLGCSGMIVRDANGAPIGITTAEHCNLRDIHKQRITGPDGKTYIIMPSDALALTGDSMDNLATAGKLTEFRLNPVGDTFKDSVYGAFENHTTDEVQASDNRMTEAEVEAMKLGDVIYMSGWPIDQDNNNSGVDRRQEFAMTVLGTRVAYMSSGEAIRVLWAAVPSNKDGAECSFRSSGSRGFTIENGKMKHVGDLAAFDDLVGDTYRSPEEAVKVRKFYEQEFGVDLEGMAVVCGFAYQLPTETVEVVHSQDEIPKPGDVKPDPNPEVKPEDAFMKESREKFFDPEYKRTIVDGVARVKVDDPKAGPIEVLVDRPTIFYDPKTGETLLARYSGNAEKNLEFTKYDNLQGIDLVDRDEEDGIGMLTSTGILEQIETQPGTINYGGWRDKKGLEFGRVVFDFDLTGKLQYVLYMDADGTLKIRALTPMK